MEERMMARINKSMLEQIAGILTFAKRPRLRDHIQRGCNLSSEQFHAYIPNLLDAGLLDGYPAIDLQHVGGPKVRHRMIYQVSRKGRQFLMTHDYLIQLLTLKANKNDQRKETQGQSIREILRAALQT